MKLNSMRYKGFVWPHNPAAYSISYARNMALHNIPFGSYHLQSLGLTRRVMKGEGAFVGETAYRQFKELAAVFYENTPGVLFHPLWDTTSAWFVNLELQQEPREDYVKYKFEFWENASSYQTGVEALSTAQSESVGNPNSTDFPWNSTGDQAYGQTTSNSAQTNPLALQMVNFHTVGQNETLWGIAQKYAVDLSVLLSLNPQLKNPNMLYFGQKVRIP